MRPEYLYPEYSPGARQRRAATVTESFNAFQAAWGKKYAHAGAGNWIYDAAPQSAGCAASAFYRQSLQIQQLLAELFHNAYALRGIDGPEDVTNSPPYLQDLAQKTLHIAQQALTITVNSPSYREGLKYGQFETAPQSNQ